MESRRHWIGRALVCLTLAGGLFTAPLSARRFGIVVTDAPAFVVIINGDNDVSVDCSAGTVRVIVDGLPAVFTTACNAVTSLTVDASITGFTHTINLTSVTSALFTALPSTHIVGGSNDDTIIGSPLPDVIDGGPGDDDISGLTGVDTIDGGVGDDVIAGGTGDDILTGGPNLDQFNWAPGDGNDTVDGGADADHVAFDGSAANETFTIASAGPGFTIALSGGGGSVSASNVETLALRAFGGDDVVNTTGLATTSQNLDGGTEATADTLNVNPSGACVDIASSPINLPGSQPIAFVNFESLTGPCAVPAMPPVLLFVIGAGLAALVLGQGRRLRFA